VCGTCLLQAGNVPALALWSALPVGFLVTAILVVNNLRDIDTDRTAGKQTLAVRLGATAARSEYVALLVLAYLVPAVMLLLGAGSLWLFLTWLSLPLAYRRLRLVLYQQGRILNQALAGTAQLTLVYAILFAIGLVVWRIAGSG